MNWEDLVEIHQNLPMPQPVFFRLYHDEHGTPLFYSMEDLPGTYIEVDAATYARNSMKVQVKNGKIIELVWKIPIKLRSGDTGTPCDPRDVCIVVGPDHPNIKWSKHGYQTS